MRIAIPAWGRKMLYLMDLGHSPTESVKVVRGMYSFTKDELDAFLGLLAKSKIAQVAND
jgi:hypothetical protein